MAVFIIFPKFRNTFQYPLSKRLCKCLPKHVSRVVAFIIELYREYESRGRPCHCAAAFAQFDPWSRDHVGRAPSCRSVGDIKVFQNDFAFIISTETCFWLKGVSDRTFFRRSSPPNQNSFAFIICKNHPESRFGNLNFYARSVMINAPYDSITNLVHPISVYCNIIYRRWSDKTLVTQVFL